MNLGDDTYEQSVMYDADSIDESSSCVITEGNTAKQCQVLVSLYNIFRGNVS